MRESLIFYRSFYEAIKTLPPANQAKIYDAIFSYSLDFQEPKLEGIDNAIFTLIKPQLDANIRKYENGKKGAEHGKKGGRPKKANGKPNGKPKKKLSEDENINRNKVFIKPTEEEVINYFEEKGYRKDIAKKAFLYYSEMDWHDSRGKPIKNWKGKMVAVWFKDEHKAIVKGKVNLREINNDRKNHTS